MTNHKSPVNMNQMGSPWIRLKPTKQISAKWLERTCLVCLRLHSDWIFSTSSGHRNDQQFKAWKKSVVFNFVMIIFRSCTSMPAFIWRFDHYFSKLWFGFWLPCVLLNQAPNGAHKSMTSEVYLHTESNVLLPYLIPSPSRPKARHTMD